MPAFINAWISRNGVHGSALPGRSTSGIFSAIAGHPQPVHAGRVARQHDAERLRLRIEADRLAVDLAEAAIEHRRVEPARQAAQDGADVPHHRRDALHVAAHHHERHARRRRQLLDVVVRPLRVVAERQRVVQEDVRRARGPSRSAASPGSARAPRASRLREQIAANQPDVRLADLDERLAGRVVRRPRDVEAAIRPAAAEQGDVEHGDESNCVALRPVAMTGSRVPGRWRS